MGSGIPSSTEGVDVRLSKIYGVPALSSVAVVGFACTVAGCGQGATPSASPIVASPSSTPTTSAILTCNAPSGVEPRRITLDVLISGAPESDLNRRVGPITFTISPGGMRVRTGSQTVLSTNGISLTAVTCALPAGNYTFCTTQVKVSCQTVENSAFFYAGPIGLTFSAESNSATPYS